MGEEGRSDGKQEPKLSCHVCMKEIPESVVQTEEGEGYVHYFCGLECFQKWEKKKAAGTAPPAEEKEPGR